MQSSLLSSDNLKSSTAEFNPKTNIIVVYVSAYLTTSLALFKSHKWEYRKIFKKNHHHHHHVHEGLGVFPVP